MSVNGNSNIKLDVFEVVDSEEEQEADIKNVDSSGAPEATASDGKEFYCPQCDVSIVGSGTWSHHLESRFHKRCVELDNEFVLNEDDLFVDDESPLSVFTAGYKGYLVGLEFLIEDKTANDIKCILCRAFLRTNVNVIEHVKGHGHQLKYLTKVEPGYVKSLRQKSLKNFEMSQAVNNRCCEIVRRLGRQKVRVHEKNHEEKKRQKILNLVAKQIGKNSETKRSSNGIQVDDLDEMPKSEMITKTLLMAKIETFPDKEVSYVDDVMKELPGPVLGLEYVAEYTDANNVYEPGYFCFLCESVMNSSQLVTHVVKKDHKLKYLQRDHHNYYNILTFPGFSKERKDELIDKYCREIEESSGRLSIRSRAILPPDGEFVFKYHRKIGGKDDEKCSVDDGSKATGLLSLQKQRQKQMEAKEKIVAATMTKPVISLVPKPPPGFLGAVTVGHQLPITSLPPPGVVLHVPPAAIVTQNLHLESSLPHSTIVNPSPQVTNVVSQSAQSAIQTANFPYPPPVNTLNYSGPVFESSTTPLAPVFSNRAAPICRRPTDDFHQASDESSVLFLNSRSNPAPSFPNVQARKPDFIYSERALKERRFAELDKRLPEFSDRNLDSGWFSLRAFSWDYCRKRNHDCDFVSVRGKLPPGSQYGDWSPYLMRRLQDQFNFGIDHLAWLQEQFLRWRTPLYIPLEMFDLRPLEDDVETAVLENLVGKVLKPGSKSRKVYDHSTPYVSSFVKKRRFDVIEYNHQENGEKVVEAVSIDDDRKSVDSNSRQTLEKNPTPVPYQQDLLLLSDKILDASREKVRDTKNLILNELLGYGEGARYILYNLTLKDKNNMNKLVEIIKNPNCEIDAAFFNEMKEKFREFAKL